MANQPPHNSPSNEPIDDDSIDINDNSIDLSSDSIDLSGDSVAAGALGESGQYDPNQASACDISGIKRIRKKKKKKKKIVRRTDKTLSASSTPPMSKEPSPSTPDAQTPDVSSDTDAQTPDTRSSLEDELSGGELIRKKKKKKKKIIRVVKSASKQVSPQTPVTDEHLSNAASVSHEDHDHDAPKKVVKRKKKRRRKIKIDLDGELLDLKIEIQAEPNEDELKRNNLPGITKQPSKDLGDDSFDENASIDLPGISVDSAGASVEDMVDSVLLTDKPTPKTEKESYLEALGDVLGYDVEEAREMIAEARSRGEIADEDFNIYDTLSPEQMRLRVCRKRKRVRKKNANIEWRRTDLSGLAKLNAVRKLYKPTEIAEELFWFYRPRWTDVRAWHAITVAMVLLITIALQFVLMPKSPHVVSPKRFKTVCGTCDKVFDIKRAHFTRWTFYQAHPKNYIRRYPKEKMPAPPTCPHCKTVVPLLSLFSHSTNGTKFIYARDITTPMPKTAKEFSTIANFAPKPTKK